MCIEKREQRETPITQKNYNLTLSSVALWLKLYFKKLKAMCILSPLEQWMFRLQCDMQGITK